ncbi:MAG: 1,4-dihydroxy-2-naphthoate polyprenyltransferase [Bacteroidales bacterium]|nr:1,4-dihydroxy-2-naphthoate polyprenyltransferase [Bacteroidales bacterium]
MSSSRVGAWIEAFRLRTLPLSFSLIIMGSAIAYQYGVFDWLIFGCALLTTLFLQILSNISNDYGDAVSGADMAGRVGPARAVQSGKISKEQMKSAIYVFSVLSLVSGLILLYVALPRLEAAGFWLMLGVGIMSIVAAICYTVGKRPYGYRGLGDLSVFIFFGIVGVMGSFVLYNGSPEWEVLLPAAGIGLLSVGVLNMNNMRDYESDKRSGKNTIIVKMGLDWGRKYQVTVIVGAFVAIAIYVMMWGKMWQMLYLLSLVKFVPHLMYVTKKENETKLDDQLKVVSVGTLIVSLLFTLGSVI